MFKSQIILSIVAVVAVVVLYNLPNVVVDNEQLEINPEIVNEENEGFTLADATLDIHQPSLNSEQIEKINQLSHKFFASSNPEKSAIFADSLAQLFLAANKYDSAAKYIELAIANNPITTYWLKAGDIFYMAFQLTEGLQKTRLGGRARLYFAKALQQGIGDEQEFEVKNKVAMTWVSTSTPMKGIQMLREIIDKEPENEQALFNLGVLSLQSGQLIKAKERFEQLVSLYPENIHGQLMLGVSLMELGEAQQAAQRFTKVKEISNDPAIVGMANGYLQEIK